MRLYLCGPMTGKKQFNFPAFLQEAQKLRAAGYEVVSPAEMAMEEGFDPIKNPSIKCSEKKRREFLEKDKHVMMTCDGLALMKGWAKSKGCEEEVFCFDAGGKRHRYDSIHSVDHWIVLAQIHPDIFQDDIKQHSAIRTFDTGANRDTDNNKLDFDGFLCPMVLERFAQYMHTNRKMADGSMRSADNWKKGIPQDVYRKSSWRHFFGFWKNCLSGDKKQAVVDACGILFNVMGWMHEELKNNEPNHHTP